MAKHGNLSGKSFVEDVFVDNGLEIPMLGIECVVALNHGGWPER